MVKKHSKNTGFIIFFFEALVLIHLKGNCGEGEEGNDVFHSFKSNPQKEFQSENICFLAK
jgi:hypothetical protein